MSEKGKQEQKKSFLSQFTFFGINTLVCFSEFVFLVLHWGFLFNLVPILQKRLAAPYVIGMFTWELIPLYAVRFLGSPVPWLPHYNKISNTHLFLHTLQYIHVLYAGPPDFSDTNVPLSVKYFGMLYAAIDTLVHTSVTYMLFVASKNRGRVYIYSFVLGLLLAHSLFMTLEGEWFTEAYRIKHL